MLRRAAFLIFAVLSPRLLGLDLYVSTSGSDANSGTSAAPFATINQARVAVRALAGTSGLPAGGVSVWIHGGYYNQAAPLAFDSADSGTSSNPVNYSAFPGELVFVTGAQALNPAAFAVVTSSSPVWSRIDPSAQGNLYSVSLPALGITNYGTIKSGGFGLTVSSALELFCNGQPMTLGRWPNAGQPYARTTSVQSGTQFTLSGTRPLRWTQAPDIWFHGLWNTTWADYQLSVSSMNTSTGAFTVSSAPLEFGIGANQPFYAFNLLEEIDAPGEYYVDRTSGILYFWPPVPLSGSTLQASMLEAALVQLNSASYVTFRNITFEASRGPLLQVSSGTGSGAVGCLFRNSGQYAVSISGTSNGLEQCEIADSGEDGVIVSGGVRSSLTAGNNYVTNCRIHRAGRLSWAYHPGINLNDGCGNLVAHNLGDELPHSAVLVTGNDHVIEYNEISRACQFTSDVGAIYSGRDWGYRGNVIDGNFVHHIQGSTEGSNIHGVFLDDLMSSAQVTGNVFFDVSGAAIACGGGRDNIMTNNIIGQCGIGHFNGDYARSSVDNVPGDSFNLLGRLAAEGIQYQSGAWAAAYPSCAAIPNSFATIEQGLWRNPQGCVFSNNAGWANTSWTTELDTSGTGVFAVYSAMANNNPGQAAMFSEAASWDRTLRPAQLTASVSGFTAISFSTIGPLVAGSSTVNLPPPAPVLQVLASTNSEVNLQWTDDGIHPEQQETNFELQRENLPGGSWQAIATYGPDVTFGSATGAAPSTSYGFRIRSYNAVGSVYSNVVSVTTGVPALVLGTPVQTPAGSALTILNDVKHNGIIGSLAATTQATASISMYDVGDSIQIAFTTGAGLYQIGVRGRCGDTIFPTFYWPSGYQYALDGSAITLTGDPTTVSPFDPQNGGFYWGTMLTSPMAMAAGSHTLTITTQIPWAAVNFLSVTPMVPPTVTTFAQWQQTHFSADQVASGTLTAWSATPAGDAFPNLLKYSLGLDPWTFYPASGMQVSTVSGEPVLTYSRPTALTDVTYFAEASNNLSTWSSVTQAVTGQSNGTATVKASETGTPFQYIRLRVVCGSWTAASGPMATGVPVVASLASPLTVVNDVGLLGTVGVSSDSFDNVPKVRLYDVGDAASATLTTNAGSYVIGVSVRSGDLVGKTDFWGSKGYTFTLDGAPIVLTGNTPTVSTLDPSFGTTYWGTMFSAPVALTQGVHTIVVKSGRSWSMASGAEAIAQ
ncbi:MAG TPA: right-handed parallel beta-helix repeat-containing protein [Opitutaceae bacterium]